MPKAELLETIARVRRAMPRNSDVMTICDEAERLTIERGSSYRSNYKNLDQRRAYMREYMRKRRMANKA